MIYWFLFGVFCLFILLFIWAICKASKLSDTFYGSIIEKYEKMCPYKLESSEVNTMEYLNNIFDVEVPVEIRRWLLDYITTEDKEAKQHLLLLRDYLNNLFTEENSKNQ